MNLLKAALITIGIIFLTVSAQAAVSEQDKIKTYAECLQWVNDYFRVTEEQTGRNLSEEHKKRNRILNCGKNKEDWEKNIFPYYTYQ